MQDARFGQLPHARQGVPAHMPSRIKRHQRRLSAAYQFGERCLEVTARLGHPKTWVEGALADGLGEGEVHGCLNLLLTQRGDTYLGHRPSSRGVPRRAPLSDICSHWAW